MADAKISQLTGATTPVAGTEVLPIVQSGSTKKVSIDNLTKGRTVNATTFDTDVAAAGVTLSGTTLAADGTDANIDINITPKGTGALKTARVGINVTNQLGRFHANVGAGGNPVGSLTSVDPEGLLITDSGEAEHMAVVRAADGGSGFPADTEMQFLVKRFNGVNYVWYLAGKLTKDGQMNVANNLLLSANGAATGDNLNSGGGNNGTYNGLAILSNTKTIGTQANNTLPSWYVDLGGRAADGSTFPVGTADKFRIARVAAGGTYYGSTDLLTVDNAGNVTAPAGNLVIGTAGKGIDFAADAHATGMTSELLDDYEEGTWTPTVKGASPNGTYETTSATYGTYVKVGKIVHINCYITLAAAVTGGGGAYMVIDGLPFAKIANSFSSGAFGCSGIDFDADTMWATIQFTSTTFNTGALYVAQMKDNGASVDLPISAVAANDVMWFSLSYEAHGY